MELGFDFPEQQTPGIGSDLAPIEPPHNFAAAEALEKQLLLATLCHSKTAPSLRRNENTLQTLTSRKAVLVFLLVRNAG
jgi:hypothetical protein